MLPPDGFIFVLPLEPRISRRALRWPELLSDLGVFDGVRGGRGRESSVSVSVGVEERGEQAGDVHQLKQFSGLDPI